MLQREYEGYLNQLRVEVTPYVISLAWDDEDKRWITRRCECECLCDECSFFIECIPCECEGDILATFREVLPERY